jgi:hypothetical protein
MYQICKQIWQHEPVLFTAMVLQSANFIQCHTKKQWWMWISLYTKVTDCTNYTEAMWKITWVVGETELETLTLWLLLYSLPVCINWTKVLATYSEGEITCSTCNVPVNRRLDNWNVTQGTAHEGEYNSVREIRRRSAGFIILPDKKNSRHAMLL